MYIFRIESLTSKLATGNGNRTGTRTGSEDVGMLPDDSWFGVIGNKQCIYICK